MVERKKERKTQWYEGRVRKAIYEGYEGGRIFATQDEKEQFQKSVRGAREDFEIMKKNETLDRDNLIILHNRIYKKND